MPWGLSQNKLFAALAAVILSVIIAVVGYFITRPYVQYEEGQVYKSGNVAVASLRLENHGYVDAEQVLVEAAFNEPIAEITSGNALSPYTVTTGGKGFKTVVGSIPRINPSQPIYVYFTVDNSTGVIGEYIPGFVRQVSFKNGVGSRNPPWWRFWGLTFLGVLVGAFVTFVIGYLAQKAIVKTAELEEAKRTLQEYKTGLQKISDRVDAVLDRLRARQELKAKNKSEEPKQLEK